MDISEAQDLLEEAKSAWGENYAHFKENLEFSAGINQWDEKSYNDRINQSRPALTINRLPQFIHQVTNEVRMNTPSLNVLPVDDKADIETAKMLKGLLKNIEYVSSADVAYDTALEYAVKGGMGFIRLDHDYISPTAFEQHILIKRMVNPLSCWIDPSSTECDGSDAQWAIILDTLDQRTFKRLYPDAALQSFDQKEQKELKETDPITIAEVFRIEYETKEVGMDDNGEMSEVVEGQTYKSKRKIKKPTVHRYKMSGADILEETTFPGKYIPIIPVYGEENWIDGKRYIFSLISHAKDSQRMYNYWASLETELLSKSPQAPVMAAAGQTEDWAQDWRDPSRAVVLRYKTEVDGHPVPPPQRLMPAQVPTGVVNARLGTVEDMKATMGIYDASLGQRSNETSGVAINNRKKEGEVATFHFGDNLVRSITHLGRVALGMVSEIYDTARVLRIIGEEEKPQSVRVNSDTLAHGQKQAFMMDAGEYDIRVTTGPSFTTSRQETFAQIGQVLQGNPQLMGVIGDLFFKYSDTPGAEAISERLKKTIPPQITAESGDDPEKQHMMQALQQSQMEKQQMQQQMMQMDAALKDKSQSEQAKTQLEMQKIDLEKQKLSVDSQKVKIDAFNAKMQALQPQPQGAVTIPFGLEQEMGDLDPVQVQQQQFAAQQEMDANKVENVLKAQQIDLQKAQMHQSELDRQQRAQETAILMQGLGGIQEAVNGLMVSVNKPKQIVRDANGAIQGVN